MQKPAKKKDYNKKQGGPRPADSKLSALVKGRGVETLDDIRCRFGMCESEL